MRYFFRRRVARETLYWSIDEAVDYLSEESKWGQLKKGRQMGMVAKAEIEKAAEDGDIIILGYLDETREHSEIPTKYWKTASIYSDFPGGITGKKRGTTYSPSKIYKLLLLKSKDVKKMWRPAFPWERRSTYKAYEREGLKVIESPTSDTEDSQSQ